MIERDFMKTDFNNIITPIIETLERKRRDYGGSFERLRDEFGEVAFYVRIWDKILRLQQVDKNGDSVGEAATDTIKDIIGYCLLELRYRGKGSGDAKND